MFFFYYCLFTHFCPCSACFKLICTPQLFHISVLFHAMLCIFLSIFFISHSMFFILYFCTVYYPVSILLTVWCSLNLHTSRNTKIYVLILISAFLAIQFSSCWILNVSSPRTHFAGNRSAVLYEVCLRSPASVNRTQYSLCNLSPICNTS